MRTSGEIENREAFRRLIGGIKRGYALAFIASIGLNLLALVTPVYMSQIYDRVLLTGSIDTLLFLTVICAVALAVLGALDALRSAILSRIGAWFERTLRFELLSAVLRIAFERGNTAGQQMLNDLQAVKAYIGSVQIAALLDGPWVPVFMGVIWLIHPWLGGCATLSALLLFGIAIATDRLTTKRIKSLGADNVTVARLSQQLIANHDTALGMGMAPAVFGHMDSILTRIQGDGQTIADRLAALTGITKFVRLFVQIGTLGLGAYLVIDGQLTSGGMLAASLILGRALAPVEQAIASWRASASAWHAFRRIEDFFGTAGLAEEDFALPAPTGAIAVENLGFVAPGKEKPILRGINFRLDPGTVLAVIGPSGAGKTTLCRLLVGSLRPRAGHVRLDGADVSTWNRHDLGHYVGYLPQTVELFEGTVRDNIARFRHADDAEIARAGRLAHCHDLILHLPAGYLTNVGEAGEYLSGGERQRVGLARALFGSPKLVVLDEPNSNLDHDGEQALQQAIADLKGSGCTVIIVTHRPALLGSVDVVAILRDGTLDRIGERDAVLRDLGVETMPRPRQAQSAAGA